MDNSSYFCNRFQKEIMRRYASSCNRKCEKLPDYNARRCNGSRVLRGLETHLHYKVFSQPPIKDVVYGTTLHCYGSFAQIGAARATKVVPDTIKGEVYELF